MGVNKVIYGNTPIVDLTDSTVTPQNLLAGEVAYSASGNRVVGEVVTTTVVPNPEGEATVELEKIQIGDTIYSLPSSSEEGGYLTADGNCYSTLPVYSDENDILKIQFKFWNKDASADNQTIIGSSFAGNSDYLLYMTVENGEPIYSYAIANNYTYIKAPRSTEDYDDIELGYDYMIVNGTTYTSQTPAKHSVHRPICVFGSNYRGSGTIGEIKIYKNDVLTYDLVPSQWTGDIGRFIDVLNDDTPYPSEGTSDYGYISPSSTGNGHTILNDNGIPLAQENNLQFKGTYSHDDSTNGKTIVEVTRSMTRAEFDQLTPAEKKGVISITDESGLPWKDITGVLSAGETEIILSDGAITNNSTFEVFTAPIEVSHTDMILVNNESSLINDILSGADGTKVTASSSDSADVPPWKAFDGIKGISSGTYVSPYHSWLPSNGEAPCWLQYHFATAKYIDEVKVYVYCNNGTYTGSAKIQGSNNGTTWTDISSAVSISAPYNEEIELDFACDGNQYSYVRLYSESAFTVYGGASIFVGEMEIYGRNSANGVKVTFPAQAENLNVKVRIS